MKGHPESQKVLESPNLVQMPTVAARWRYKPPINNLTAHYDRQFYVRFHFFSHQEAQKQL